MEHLRALIQYFKDKHPEATWPRAKEEMFAHVEEVLLPHLLRVIQKDNTLFTETKVELIPGADISALWDGSDDAWKRVQMALLYSVLHGDPKEKFGKILETIKSLIPGGSAKADEISGILDSEENQNSMKEILELVMNTRIASLVGEIAQSISLDDLGIDFEDTDALMNMLRNPTESPVLSELMGRVQSLLEERVKSGKINQQELVREIEMLRAKFQSSFGKYLNEMVVGDAGGGTTGNTSAQILSGHPEARRARMLARLQKKQKEKGRK
jgi:hypothetical protein